MIKLKLKKKEHKLGRENIIAVNSFIYMRMSVVKTTSLLIFFVYLS